jgi:DNA-binding response OmpR family regulator/tetratricopeptide (TPR) repeat protein
VGLPSVQSQPLQLEAGTLDWVAGVLHTPAGRVDLGQQGRLLLGVLVPRAGEVVPVEELCERLWPGRTRQDRALSVAIHRLRTRIELDPVRPAHLRTVRGEGYVLDLLSPVPAPQARPAPAGLLRLTDGVLDLGTGVVRRHGGVAELGTGELELVRALAAAGEPLPREALKLTVGYRAQSRTRAVDAALARIRKKIEADPQHPVHLITVRGRGIQLVAAPPPVGRPLSFSRPMFGREPELALLQRRMAEGVRLLVLVGPAGVGKSRLAAEMFDRWFGAQGLAVAPSAPEELVAAVADALSVRGEAVREALRRRGSVGLWLDGLEGLGLAERGELEQWLLYCPELRVLATSRERLGLPGEVICEVGPLEPLDALALYQARVADLGVELPPSARLELPSLGALLAEHDHLPLAIELLAGMADVCSPELAQKGAVAEGGVLQRALMRSWQQLTPPLQAALAQSAVFCAPFSLSAAEAVLEPARTGPVAPALAALRRKSLLRTQPDATGELRFDLWHTVRAFALAHGEPAALAQARARHVEWATKDARAELISALGKGPAPPDPHRAAELRAVLRASTDPVVRTDAVIGLRQWYRHHDLRALTEMLAELSPHLAALDPDRRACLALLEVYADTGPVLPELPRYLALLEDVSDPRLAAGFRFVLAVALASGQPEQSRALAEQLATSPLPRARAWGEHVLASLLLEQGDLLQTAEHAERAAALSRAHGSPEEVSMALTMLAACHRQQGRLQDARTELMSALAAVPSGPMADQTRTHLGLLHLSRFEPELALDAFSLALDAYRLRGEPKDLLDAVIGSGLAELERGQRRAAEAWFAQAELQPLPRSYEIELACARALGAWDGGDGRGASQRLSALWRAEPPGTASASVGLALGLVWMAERELEQAISVLSQAGESEPIGAALALALARQGRVEQARQRLGLERPREAPSLLALLEAVARCEIGVGEIGVGEIGVGESEGGRHSLALIEPLCGRSIEARLLRAIVSAGRP